ncbi:MAG TPA: hypothetical protein PLV25_03365, partial [Opitutales bacterium]|nr:hypothetical protein [Opitutales bacterium]
LESHPRVAVAQEPIYLLGENHQTAQDALLFKALTQAAKDKRIVLGVESIRLNNSLDMRCELNNICDLTAANTDYVIAMEEPFAYILANLVRLYARLLLIEKFEQLLNSPELDASARAYILDVLPKLWDHPNGLPNLMALIWDFSLDDVSWSALSQVKKGPEWGQITRAIHAFRQLGSKGYSKRNFEALMQAPRILSWVVRYAAYSQKNLCGLLNELEPMLIELSGLFLADEAHADLPEPLRARFEGLVARILELRAGPIRTFDDGAVYLDWETTVLDLYTLPLRDFFIAKQAALSWEIASQKGVPLIVVTGYAHTPGVYMFLKHKGIPAEIGLSKNVAKLSPAEAHRAEEKNWQHIKGLILEHNELAPEAKAFFEQEDRALDQKGEQEAEVGFITSLLQKLWM